MIKTVEGVEYITVPEEKSGYCNGCVAEANSESCKALQEPHFCKDIKSIFKKKGKTMKIIDYKSLICNTSYNILSAKLEDEVKRKYGIDDIEELVSSEIENIENDDVKNFIDSLVEDSTNNEKVELRDEVVRSAVEDFLRRMTSYDIYGYDSIEEVTEVAENILTEELIDTLIDENFEEFKEQFFDSVFEVIADSEILSSVEFIFSEASEKVMEKVINDIIHRKVASFILDNF